MIKPTAKRKDRLELIQATIIQNPDWNQERLARALGLSQSTIAKHMARLRAEGVELPDHRTKTRGGNPYQKSKSGNPSNPYQK